MLVLSDINEQVMQQLERDTIIDLIGKDYVFGTFRDAVVAYQKVIEESEKIPGNFPDIQ